MTVALVGSDWALIAALVPLTILAFVDIGLITIARWLVRHAQLRTGGHDG